MLEYSSNGSCPECQGTGVVSYWSESVNFEDQRICSSCEAGRRMVSKISELERAASEESVAASRTHHLYRQLSS
jgi:DnaJ-class molecular chaperone